MSKKVVVTGAAGFIGSSMVDFLLESGYQVIGLDNISTGRKEFLTQALLSPNFALVETDLLFDNTWVEVFFGAETVFHFAANADVRFGADHPGRDLEQNTIVTQRVLEAARKAQIKNFIFASTGSVYGEATVIPTPENSPFPVQTSLYGASKLACEGLIEAYAETFGMRAWIFRFVSILGPRYTHGHVFDFFEQLTINPAKLSVLGNGFQKKSYLNVYDCVAAIHQAILNNNEKIEIFNLGYDGYCTVRDSVSWICDELKLMPEITYGESEKGWVGDNPFIYLDTSKIASLGWKPRSNIEQSVRQTVQYLKNNWAELNKDSIQ